MTGGDAPADSEAPHPLQLRVHAERLVRRRGPSDRQRYAIAQRRGRIDANPHQIDAVVFALSRIPEGGCILADEVGLGKTIEAGLVIAQLLTEGSRRILIMVPKPLLGQWRDEMFTLFGIEAREVDGKPENLLGEGVYIVGREWAGGTTGAPMLGSAEKFDLVVIDEAHEYFANIYRRFDSEGLYNPDSSHSVTAGRVRDLVRATPVLLLTATPIQNSLLELWGLAQFVQTRGTVLGDLPTFRELFCADSQGREIAPERADDLRKRLSEICQRTLREQAKPFLEVPFVGRFAQTFEYPMTDEERALYDDVTDYLLDPESLAFSAINRKLLLIGFHRRMASSLAALASSLETVAARLRRWRDDPSGFHSDASLVQDLVGDLDDEDLEEEAIDPRDEGSVNVMETNLESPERVTSEVLQHEIELVESFAQRARQLPHDSKAEALLEVVRARPGEKLVIFTESLATQDYIRDLLVEAAAAESDITLFRGTNESPRAREALDAWYRDLGDKMSTHERPSPKIAVRLALVHEFRTSSRIFISTEAGAKGLNLQFCNTIINYDLPWNPQRIEQRIGRCHRYGQRKDVTVVNFVARDNEAQKLTFELLAKKLELFGTVLDASDDVLHTPTGDNLPESLASAIGSDFSKRMQDIWSSARSVEDVAAELKLMRDQYEDRRRQFEESVEKTEHLIQSHLDETVGHVFQRLQSEIPAALHEIDQSIEKVVRGWLDLSDTRYTAESQDGHTRLALKDPTAISPELAELLPPSGEFAIGDSRKLPESVETIHIDHPFVEAIIADLRARTPGVRSVTVGIGGSSLPQGTRGRLILVRFRHTGLEPVEHIRLVAVGEDALPIDTSIVEQWLHLPWRDSPRETAAQTLTTEDGDDAISEALYDDLRRVDDGARERYDGLIEQIERYMDDRIVVLRRERHTVSTRLRDAEAAVSRATGPTARRKAEAKASKLETRLQDLDVRVGKLVERDDDDYQQWTADARRRRYEKPTVDRLFEADYVITGTPHNDQPGR